jgi:cobalt-zinc-cadmium efflux system outer membrane protein
MQRKLDCLVLCALLWPARLPGAEAPETVTLEQAVAEALERNLTLLAERANLPIARARLITARLRPNPVLSLGGDHLDLLGTGFNEINAAGPAEFSLRSDFLYERGGKRRSRIEAAQGALEVAELEVLNAARALRLQVQSAFVDALLAKENLALARQNREMLERIVEANAVRLRAGELAEVELVRSRLAALQQANAVRRAERELRAALIRLQSLMGRDRFMPAFDVAGELRREGAVPAPEELRRAALENRPDLLALRREGARAAAELRLELARGKVDWTFGTEYRRQQGLAGTGNMLGFFFSLPLPLFDRNQGEIERARQQIRQSELRLRALENAIRAELEDGWQQFHTARELLEQIEGRMLAQAREVREVTEYSYRRGEATLLELLDAQRAFNDTMQAYNEARAEYARSLYALEAAAGKEIR